MTEETPTKRQHVLGCRVLERECTRMALDEVEAEIGRARAKFPSNAHLMVALAEEVGELAEALLHDDGSEAGIQRIVDEATQVACVAVRIITEGDGDFPCGQPKQGGV